jgi:uncharacterized protein
MEIFVLKGLFSIVIGLIVGYLAQRSRMCFVGGIRDFILVRDKALLRGFWSFLLTAWILYSILFSVGVIHPEASTHSSVVQISAGEIGLSTFQSSTLARIINRLFIIPPRLNLLALLLAIAGFSVGFLSILANGCPLRQHVLTAQGNIDSLMYLLGFYSAVIFYDFILSGLLSRIFNYL